MYTRRTAARIAASRRRDERMWVVYYGTDTPAGYKIARRESKDDARATALERIAAGTPWVKVVPPLAYTRAGGPAAWKWTRRRGWTTTP